MYTFVRFQALYERLSKFRESDLEKGGGRDDVVETVRQITEALIWGEQNDNQFFDFFCEKSILADFVRVLGLSKAPKKVKLQLLQTLSMLVLNIRCKTSVYYILSNNHINRLIKTPLDFEDEEILAYYITLMKSLAMRLDTETVKFFFLQHPEPTFPLYIEATRFFDVRDGMVRTVVRTITLQVYRVDDLPMRKFVLRHAAETYFGQLAYHLRDLWFRLDAAASGMQDQSDLQAVQREHELSQDLLTYLSDIFELQVEELNEVLADRLLNIAMLPLLLNGVMSVKSYDVGGDGTRVLAPCVALFLLRQVFDIFHCPCLLAPLAAATLQPWVHAALAYTLPQCPLTGATSPPSSLMPQEDLMANWLREHFLHCLKSKDDATYLLAAAVVHACLLHVDTILPLMHRRQAPAWSAETWRPAPEEDAGQTRAPLLPTMSMRSAPAASGSCADSGSSFGGEARSGEDVEVFHALLQGLETYSTWQYPTLRVLARIALDVFLNPRVRADLALDGEVLRVTHSALQCAALQLKDLVLSCLEEPAPGRVWMGDWIWDSFLEEWEAHKAPLLDVGTFCTDPKRLLPAVFWEAGPPARPGAPARKQPKEVKAQDLFVIRAFLLLRRLRADLKHYGDPKNALPASEPSASSSSAAGFGAPPPWAGASDERLAWTTVEAGSERFSKGSVVDVGRFDKKVCGVAAARGKCTRYLLEHPFWFMLVQPDLARPGKANVETVFPIWQVQHCIDRGDPRTLQVFFHRPPGDDPGQGPDAPVTLNFEDVRQCHGAGNHLDKHRQIIRRGLLEKLLTFVSGDCEPAPAPAPPTRTV